LRISWCLQSHALARWRVGPDLFPFDKHKAEYYKGKPMGKIFALGK
jgi:hypothetical protein